MLFDFSQSKYEWRHPVVHKKVQFFSLRLNISGCSNSENILNVSWIMIRCSSSTQNFNYFWWDFFTCKWYRASIWQYSRIKVNGCIASFWFSFYPWICVQCNVKVALISHLMASCMADHKTTLLVFVCFVSPPRFCLFLLLELV